MLRVFRTKHARQQIMNAVRSAIRAYAQPGSGTQESVSANGSPRHAGLAPWRLKRLTLHVECNLGGNLETEALAKVAGLSVCHFNREFRKRIGVPPHRYVMQKRVEYAKRIIAGTNRSIIEVAAECGFSDQSHLTRLFKRFVGETPGVWRRTNGQS
jgi:AraC family transcriptional regulator